MSSQLAIREDQTSFTTEQMTALESLGVEGAMPAEVAMFFDQCQRTGLSPWARQIYMIGRWDSKLRRKKYQVQVSIDGFRLIAERTGQYQGQTEPQWCGPDGVWRDVWLDRQAPSAARVGVWREGFREPAYGVARLEAYMPTSREGKPSGMWASMADVMLAKCAESLALRKAFPMELSGLYTGDEMQQADQPAPVQETRPEQSTEPAAEGRVLEGEVVEDALVDDTTQQWIDAINGAGDRGQLMAVWEDAKSKGAHSNTAIRSAFAQRGQAFPAAAA